MTLEKAIDVCRKQTVRVIYSGNCSVCGNIFYTHRPVAMSCGMKCGPSVRTDRGRPFMTQCTVCSKQIRKQPSQVKRNKGKLYFCGHKCRGKYYVGPNHHLYKGGTVTSLGYRMLNNNGEHIFEHRYVMSKILGRPLHQFENVHHKDGDRLNNKPENLELWVKPQPSGQRLKDLLLFIAKFYPNEMSQVLAR